MASAMETPSSKIEIVKPCGEAWHHMKGMLFPFNFGRWITLGFVAWLALLGQGGGGGFNFNFGRRWQQGQGSPAGSVREVASKAISYIEANLILVLGIGAAAMLVVVAVGLVLAYLSSRGVFMYLDCVYERKAAVVAPWRRARKHAWSLFLWRVLFSAAGGLLGLLIVATTLFARWQDIRTLTWTPGLLGILIVSGGALLLTGIAFGLARWCLRNLVAPIMYLRNLTGSQAWSEFFGLARGRAGVFILYWLMNVALGLLVGTATTAAACCTCCVGALPIICQTILQPLFLWLRAFPFYFLAQFGPAYALPAAAAPEEEGVPAASAEAGMKVVSCPQCGQPHQIPREGAGAYACVKCGAHFDGR